MSDKSYVVFKNIMDSEGRKFNSRMKNHSFSYNIFSGNIKELNDGLRIIETPEIGLALLSQDNKEAGNQAHREINRLFHNFLASAKTLIEHTRIFINKHYKNTTIQQAYMQKIKNEYAKDELAKFIQDLRNYMLHQGLPHSQMSISFKNGDDDFESTISIERDKMKLWSRWSSASKSFLNKQDENIKLSSLIEPYGEKIIILNNWLEEELIKYHTNDLKKLEELQNKYAQFEKTI